MWKELTKVYRLQKRAYRYTNRKINLHVKKKKKNHVKRINKSITASIPSTRN